MICTQCGASVRPPATSCPSCGRAVSLPAPGESLPMSRRTIQEEPVSEYRQGAYSFRQEPSRQTDEQAPPPSPRRSGTRLTRRERQLAVGGQSFSHSRRRRSPVNVVAVILFLLVFALGAAWGVSKFWPGGEQGPALTDTADLPDITPGLSREGKPAHILTFYGKDGDILYIQEMRKNYTFLSGQVTVEVPDALFIGQELQENTVEVTLHPVLYTDSARPRDLTPVTYTIDIPPAPLEIVSPEGGSTSVYTSLFLIQLQVEPGSRVLIDEADVSDLINADNIISHNVQVLPRGDNTFDIQVETPGYKRTYAQVTISRPHMDIDLEIDVNAPVTSTQDRFNLTGKTESGATITVDPKPVEVIVADNGDFTIKMQVNRYGANKIIITASKPGREDSVIDHTVIYTPNVDEYSGKAWVMDYDHLVKNQSSFQGRIYKCTGVLKEVIEENPYIFYFDVGTGGVEQLVVIELFKDRTYRLEPGKRYDVYADLEEKYNGYPKLNGRYYFAAE